MVKVQIVEEKDQDVPNSPYMSQASSRTSSSVSLSSNESDLDAEESFYERLAALVDIVPPTTRHKISTRLSKTTGFIKTTGKVVGNIVWIVTTSALLVGLPLALSLEDEAKIVQQEKEMLAQQQGAQQVRKALPYCFLQHVFVCILTLLLFDTDACRVPILVGSEREPATTTKRTRSARVLSDPRPVTSYSTYH